MSLHRSRLVILLGAVLAAASLPLPFADLPGTGRVNGIDGDAWPGAALLAMLAAFALLGDRAEGFRPRTAVVAVATAGAAALFAALKLADAARAADVSAGSVGMGAWVLLAGAALSLVGAVLALSTRLG